MDNCENLSLMYLLCSVYNYLDDGTIWECSTIDDLFTSTKGILRSLFHIKFDSNPSFDFSSATQEEKLIFLNTVDISDVYENRFILRKCNPDQFLTLLLQLHDEFMKKYFSETYQTEYSYDRFVSQLKLYSIFAYTSDERNLPFIFHLSLTDNYCNPKETRFNSSFMNRGYIEGRNYECIFVTFDQDMLEGMDVEGKIKYVLVDQEKVIQYFSYPKKVISHFSKTFFINCNHSLFTVFLENSMIQNHQNCEILATDEGFCKTDKLCPSTKQKVRQFLSPVSSFFSRTESFLRRLSPNQSTPSPHSSSSQSPSSSSSPNLFSPTPTKEKFDSIYKTFLQSLLDTIKLNMKIFILDQLNATDGIKRDACPLFTPDFLKSDDFVNEFFSSQIQSHFDVLAKIYKEDETKCSSYMDSLKNLADLKNRLSLLLREKAQSRNFKKQNLLYFQLKCVFQKILRICKEDFFKLSQVREKSKNPLLIESKKYFTSLFSGELQHKRRGTSNSRKWKLRLASKHKEGYVAVLKYEQFSSGEKISIEKSANILHDTLVGLILNKLKDKGIHNFLFTYGGFLCSPPTSSTSIDEMCANIDPEKIKLFSLEEHVDGEPLDTFFRETPNFFRNIFFQICIALQSAQDNFGFIHGNLTPENILVVDLKEEVAITQKFKSRNVVIRTRYIPVIINYDYALIDSKTELLLPLRFTETQNGGFMQRSKAALKEAYFMDRSTYFAKKFNEPMALFTPENIDIASLLLELNVSKYIVGKTTDDIADEIFLYERFLSDKTTINFVDEDSSSRGEMDDEELDDELDEELSRFF
jgi:hypothetical protein